MPIPEMDETGGFEAPNLTDEHIAQTPILLPAIHIALTGSVYAVVAVAVERYIIICNPYNWTNQGQILQSS